jgi:nucleoside-diphosphate-sugar epimerase/putative sterol carrier protein
MKVVVTGAAGQLGSLVLAGLAANRKVKSVVALDVVPPSIPSAKTTWTKADVRDPGLDRHFEGADALIHLAFIVTKKVGPDVMRAVNVDGSRRMFQHAIDAGLSSIIYCSSLAAYGVVHGHSLPLKEDSPRKRTSVLTYSSNKYDVEEMLDEIEPAHPSVRIVRLRPGVLIGRRNAHAQDPLFRRRTLPHFSDAKVSMVWDEDVAQAVLLALGSDVRGAFNLCAAEPLDSTELGRRTGFRVIRVPRSVQKAASMLARLGTELDPEWLAVADVDLVGSSERALRELGWKPICPTTESVLRHYDEVTPRALDRRLGVFFRLVNLAARTQNQNEVPEEAKRMNLDVHLELTGQNGGDYQLLFHGGHVRLTPGIPRPPDARVTLSAETMLALLTGDDDLSRARMAGRLKVSGEPNAGFLIAGLVTTFRASRGKPGIVGWSSNKLERWFARGKER